MPEIQMHIIKIKENSLGHDHIIGDLHGELESLNSLLARLNEDDRLFLVGDLGDRGADSAGVYERILALNAECTAAGKPPKINCIRGNHEDNLLRYLNMRLNPEKFTDEAKITITNRLLQMRGEWATELTEEQMLRYKNYIESLPYIIYVDGVRPFILAHADLPFTDQEVLRRLTEKTLLNPTEIRYCTTARETGAPGFTPFIVSGRNQNSIPVYCGHTYLGGLRIDTHHYNLDIGTPTHKVICDVNHTLQTCTLISRDEVTNSDLLHVANQINQQFTLLKAQAEFARQTTRNSQVDFLELCENMLTIMGEFQERYVAIYAAEKPQHVKIYSELFTKIDTITTKLNNKQIDPADAFEEMVDLVENIVISDGHAMYPQKYQPGLFLSPELPEAYVNMLNEKPDLKHDTRMLSIILAKVYEKYYLQAKGILHDDAERKIWASQVNNIKDLYEFKTQFPDLAEKAPDNRLT